MVQLRPTPLGAAGAGLAELPIVQAGDRNGEVNERRPCCSTVTVCGPS